VAPVIGVLAGAGVRSLVCREPSLDELLPARPHDGPAGGVASHPIGTSRFISN
jgi:hypothetical protein